MAKLVEVYIANDYIGLHTFEMAKELIWPSRAYCRLKRDITEKQFKEEQDLDTLNSWMQTGKVKFVAEV